MDIWTYLKVYNCRVAANDIKYARQMFWFPAHNLNAYEYKHFLFLIKFLGCVLLEYL